jgi:hypothetical protein
MAEAPLPIPSLEEAAQQGELGQDIAATPELSTDTTPKRVEIINTAASATEEPVASSTNLAPHNGSEDGRVDDVEKAWDMAHAAKEQRDTAARIRSRIKKTEASSYESVPYDTPEDRENFEFNKRRKIYQDKEYAKDLDDFSNSLEKWAGILHDHPVSTKYEADHPGVRLDAKALVLMEEGVQAEVERVKEAEEFLEDNLGGLGLMSLNGGNAGFYATRQDLLIHNLLKGDSKAGRKYTDLQTNQETTVGEIIDFYKGLVKSRYLEPTKNKIALQRVVLDDIRGGRA